MTIRVGRAGNGGQHISLYAGDFRGVALPVIAQVTASDEGLQLQIGALHRKLTPAAPDLFAAYRMGRWMRPSLCSFNVMQRENCWVLNLMANTICACHRARKVAVAGYEVERRKPRSR